MSQIFICVSQGTCTVLHVLTFIQKCQQLGKLICKDYGIFPFMLKSIVENLTHHNFFHWDLRQISNVKLLCEDTMTVCFSWLHALVKIPDSVRVVKETARPSSLTYILAPNAVIVLQGIYFLQSLCCCPYIFFTDLIYHLIRHFKLCYRSHNFVWPITLLNGMSAAYPH